MANIAAPASATNGATRYALTALLNEYGTASLRRAESRFSWQIVVVDNASSDGSAAWTEAVVNLSVQPTPKLRVGVAECFGNRLG